MMKKVYLLITVSIIGFGNLNAQEVNNVVKLNPLGAIIGLASIGYEHAYSKHSSFVIEPTLGSFKIGDFKYSALGLSADYRYYPAKSDKDAPKGFYLSPGLGYLGGKISEPYDGSEAKFSSIFLKMVLGKQWIWGSGFIIDFNAGISYLNYKYSDNQNSYFSGLSASGVIPALAFSIGYAF